MTEIQDIIERLRLELRRGIVVIAVLRQLDVPRYGYSLIQELAQQGLEIEEGTLYPLLRRLEQQKLLESDWDVSESRPRKYYKISAEGREVLSVLSAEWQATVVIMQRILEGDSANE